MPLNIRNKKPTTSKRENVIIINKENIIMIYLIILNKEKKTWQVIDIVIDKVLVSCAKMMRVFFDWRRLMKVGLATVAVGKVW